MLIIEIKYRYMYIVYSNLKKLIFRIILLLVYNYYLCTYYTTYATFDLLLNKYINDYK